MLQPILDPFHRASRLARGEEHRDDVGENGLLGAEAPTGILRAAQPQPRAGNPQRPRHHRMQRERALEVGQHVVAVVPEVFGHDDEPLDRRARIARIAHRDRHPVRGARERSVGVAVAEAPVAHDVRADVAVQQRCAGRGRGDRIDHRVELAVLDLDPFERVFGPIAVARHHHRHRLPRVTHPIDRKCVMAHRLLHPGDERPGPRGDCPGNDGSSLVRTPTRAAHSFADTDRAVIFPIRRTGRLRSEVIAPVLGHLAAQSVLGSTITLVVPTCHVPPSIIPCVERTG